jgi:hypothetical protein
MLVIVLLLLKCGIMAGGGTRRDGALRGEGRRFRQGGDCILGEIPQVADLILELVHSFLFIYRGSHSSSCVSSFNRSPFYLCKQLSEMGWGRQFRWKMESDIG